MSKNQIKNQVNLISNPSLPSNSELEIIDKSQKKFNRKVKIASEMNITHPNLRIIQRNVIYILGIKPEIAKKEILTSQKFFGQYGEISKVFISKKPFYLKNTKDYCYNAYITFQERLSASFAIAGLNNFVFEGKKMEASYATNRYCKSFVRNKRCKNRNCNYIHKEMDASDCFIQGEGLDNRDIFQSQKVYAYKSINDSANDILKKMQSNPIHPELPTVKYIIQKAKEFMGVNSKNIPQLFEDMGKRYSAYQKTQRLSDSKTIFRNLDINFMSKDSIIRERGYFYVLNKY